MSPRGNKFNENSFTGLHGDSVNEKLGVEEGKGVQEGHLVLASSSRKPLDSHSRILLNFIYFIFLEFTLDSLSHS